MSPPSPDYPAAARRHQRDGDALFASPSGRLENSDHLYGFAAECALLGSLSILHRAGAYSKLSLSSEGAIEDQDLRCKGHIKELWSHMIGRVFHSKDRALQILFQPFSDHRDGASRNPFRDWSIFDRYRGDGYAIKERVLSHKKAAEICLKVLDQIEQSYLKRVVIKEGGT